MTRQAARSTTRFANHSYPSFYACYLLKSLSTTYKGNRSTRYRYFSVSPSLRLYERAILSRTYIGSTPNPPRRIRQHNGEITSGATKTAQGRPWTMQMLVYGFPGRLSALQYEWAFQHPWKARHLKSAGAIFPKTGRTLKHNVEVAQTMVCTHPYNTMALHVKIFDNEANKYWDEACEKGPPLPHGLNVSIELEGVDGKSGRKGSGRTVPIDVKDVEFTSAHLRKNTSLLAHSTSLSCFFCSMNLDQYSSDPLSHALCPSHDCFMVSHLECLSEYLLADSALLIPRGGHCPSCASHILWGDVVKGCYRRSAGGATVCEDDEAGPNVDLLGPESDEDLAEPSGMSKKAKGKRKAKDHPPPTLATMKRKTKADSSSEGESFDFGESDADATTKKKKPKPNTKDPPRTKRKASKADISSSEGELFDFGQVDEDSEGSQPTPRKRGRPAKVPSPPPLTPSPKRRGRPPNASKLTPVKRPVGRPRKDSRNMHTDAAMDVYSTRFSSDEEEAGLGMDKVARTLSVLSLSSPSPPPPPPRKRILIEVSD